MKRIENKPTVVLYLVSCLLLIVNISLIYQNLSLRSEIERNAPPLPREGDLLTAFHAKDLDGNDAKIDFRDGKRKTVLLFFKSTCSFCKEQMRYWDRLIATADREKFSIAAVTTESNSQAVKDYLESYGAIEWRVLRIKSEDAQIAKFSQTPITIVIDNEGKIEKSWPGRWQNKIVDIAGKYFSVDFSGL